MARPTERLTAPVVIGVATVAMTVAYLIIIVSEDEGFSSRVWFVAAYLLVASAGALIGQWGRTPRARLVGLAWAASSLVVLGLLAAASIGVFLLVLGACLVPSLRRARIAAPAATWIGLAFGLSTIPVLVLGVMVTS